VTTDDNRPQAAGGYSDSGLYHSGNESYAGQDYGRPSTDPSGSSMYDDAGYSSAPTTVLPGTTAYDPDLGLDDEEEPRKRTAEWHGGLDFGLLVLRLVLGGFFVVHGTDKLFGWFNYIGGMNGTRAMLAEFGFTEPNVLAWVLAITEVTGGVLLILGLFTPAGAAAILGVAANVIVVDSDWNQFLGNVELEMVYAAAAFVLLFTGPGRVSLDRHTHWFRKAPAYGFVFLLLAAGASLVTLLVFR
jgi:putative oxidoreductase